MSESRPIIALLGDSESGRQELAKSMKSFNIGNKVMPLSFIELPDDAKRIKETELLKSALISIIAIDLLSGFEAAKKSLKKWLQVKDEIFPVASVYLVGTNLDLIAKDDASQHTSLTANMCKLAVQKDAIYLEMSCNDISNVSGIKALFDLIFLRLRGMAQEAERLAIFYDDPELEDCADALSVVRRRIEDIKADLMQSPSYLPAVSSADNTVSNSSTKKESRADSSHIATSEIYRSFVDMGLEWPLSSSIVDAYQVKRTVSGNRSHRFDASIVSSEVDDLDSDPVTLRQNPQESITEIAYRVSIRVPPPQVAGPVHHRGQAAEIVLIMRENDDPAIVAKTIADEHGLSSSQERTLREALVAYVLTKQPHAAFGNIL